MNWVPDFRQVKAFVAVADQGSFTLAAKQIFVTQSAVSHSIRALEEQLDCKLLDRSRRKVKLTAEGEIFFRHCSRVLQELDNAKRGLEQRRAAS
ncbi:MAG: LysR family transcriptional regulator [Akkermansiaceae bacterium]|nr:LysR family transcriptional regulator [Akkermansiaceae bacterium]